ncbi:hypothetical protein, partial [Streptomyces sp. SID3212]|uniref:hypothetical protein n=1 Tax=Streptomyces sp. SID3212 TaxID=2690259 RepID=UPI001F32F07A
MTRRSPLPWTQPAPNTEWRTSCPAGKRRSAGRSGLSAVSWAAGTPPVGAAGPSAAPTVRDGSARSSPGFSEPFSEPCSGATAD